ncbi:hypothetical protein NCCP1664_25130 [Zafaria cholistanensis]|uniref:Recombinase family protein n=1 Tax=Zafaria cholistanensis TaxID=1682741 RepID=A0A5A7NVC2_9MICC|nr:recombinase family protein [Zafaria cholistanensis]GER24018.1 hypothetical protein NCCP1664_25130 [Zafaria cholistanensis]
MSRRAITYARQSKQREDESQGSPEAQRRQTRALIQARDWTFAGHYEDLGASGYNPKVARPGLDAALAAVARREADVLVVYRLDRLTRQGVAEALRIVGVLREHNAALVSAEEPFLDTSTAMGTGIFGLFAALAEQESENISARSRSAKATLRAVGSHAGGRPPFGFSAERVVNGTLTVRRLVPEPTEAAVVREAVKRVLSGESVLSLARELNARNLRPRSGAEWTTSTLTRILRAPQLAGYMPAHRAGRNVEVPRDSRGRLMLERDDNGAPLRPWKALIDPADWHRLQDILEARPVTRGTAKEPSLLGGTSLMVCSLCGGGMGAARRRNIPTGGAYRCMRHKRGGGCTGTSVSMFHAEDYVARAVFSRLAALDPQDPDDLDFLLTATERFAARTEDGKVAAERATLQASIDSTRSALERLDDDRAAGIFDGETGTARYRRQVATLTARLEVAHKALTALPASSANLAPWLDSLSYSDSGPIGPGSAWDAWDVGERREFLRMALDRIEVLSPIRPHAGGNTPFRGEERLRLVWAGSNG